MGSISPITASLYPASPAKQPNKATAEPSRITNPQESSTSLASSIMADGGLGFLQSRLEEKIGSMFPPVSENGDQAEARVSAAPYESSGDVSAQATAQRIVGFALSMMGTYRRQNTGLDEQDLRAGFEAEIREGISDGFAHARESLGELGRLDESTEENVVSTWDWVQSLLDEHFSETT